MKPMGFAEALNEFVAERLTRPYSWGDNDCVTFCADAVIAINGNDPLEGIRDAWHDELKANEILLQEGGLVAAMDKRFVRRPRPQFAQRGDIVLIRDANLMPSLGLVLGANAAAPGPDGLLMTDMKYWIIGWEV